MPAPAISRRHLLLGAGGLSFLAACAAPVEEVPEETVNGIPLSQIVEGYGPLPDERFPLGPVPPEYLVGVNRRGHGRYLGDARPGSIEIDNYAKLLYWIESEGTAWRYSIAVGRLGRTMRGTTTVQNKREWPSWTPTANMIRSEPEIYRQFAGGVPGGPANPLGARALYLYRGGRDTMYRIHGTNDWSSIGNSGSAGCIRLFNHDIIHLFARVTMGTPVIMRSREDSIRIEGEALANRGIDLPAYFASRESIEDGTAGQRPPVLEAMMNADGTYPPEILAQLAARGMTDLADETAGTIAPHDPLSAATLGV
ncbi:MAG: L,D-transpeptidase [Rubellimicrobium sp.]|nr:L,D-transpeptidase [Rubellimicrobium sp.]